MKYLFDRLIGLVEKLPDGSFKDWLVLFVGALRQLFSHGDIFFHYGCPNSKRTAKLQLKKRIFRF